MKTTTILNRVKRAAGATFGTARRVRRAASRGVTLIEILIVLAIIGLIAGGVAVYAVPKLEQARKDTAKTDCRSIHPVADAYRANHTGQCPTVEQLRAEKELSATSNIADPWGTPYAIRCTDEDLYVLSFGPDKKEGTADDIKMPDDGHVGK